MRINDGRAIPTFLCQLLKNKDFTIFGNGKQTRSFCYITDTVNGIDNLLNSDCKTPVNIGNPKEITLIELIELIKTLKNNDCEIKYFNLPENDPKRRKPDINLAKNKLSWEPKIKLITGLKKTLDYLENELNSIN